MQTVEHKPPQSRHQCEREIDEISVHSASMPTEKWTLPSSVSIEDLKAWRCRGCHFSRQNYEEEMRSTARSLPSRRVYNARHEFRKHHPKEVRERYFLADQYLTFDKIKSTCDWNNLAEGDRKELINKKQMLQKYLLAL